MAKTYKAVQGFFCVVLVCVLVFNCFAIPRAQALTAEMTLGVAVTALVCLIISSLGVTIQAAQGQDVTDYVGSYFISWVQDKGYSDIGSWFTAVTGVSVVGWICKVGAGFLAVGKLVYDAVSQFVSYFVAQQGIESGGDPVGQLPVAPSITLPPGGSFDWVDASHASVSYTYNFQAGKAENTGFGLTGNFPAGTVVSISQSTDLPQMWLGGRYDDTHSISALFYKRPYSYVGGVTTQAVNRTSVTLPQDLVYISIGFSNLTYASGSFYAISASGTYSFTLTFSREVVGGSGAIFTPGSDVVGLPEISDDQSYRVIDSDIAVSAGVAGNLANIINKASTSEGIQTSAAVADTPVNPPDTTPIEGLQDVFPFCLPFDFARFLQILSAEREAPHFEWIIPIPAATGLDIEDQYITIDLSDFDGLAATVRNVELIAMCVGLILLTRELLKW